MIGRPRVLTMAVAALTALAGSVFAQVPSALDRIPSDAAVAISIKDVGKLRAGIEGLAKALGVPAADMEGFMKIDQVLKMQGADANGSAAVGIMSLDGDEPEAVAVIPVRDYAAFVKNFGGTGTGLEEIKLDNHPVFIKSLDGGFAAAGPDKGLVEKFGGKAGNGKAMEGMIGASGRAISSKSDIVIIANVSKLGDKIKESMQGFKDGLGMAMMMAGGDVDLGFFDTFGETMARDASAGIVGANISEDGLTLDFATQFKEGTEYAGYFSSRGKASSLLAALPNQPMLFSMAIDVSSPGMRSMMKNLQSFAKKLQPGGGQGDNPGMFPADWSENAEGLAFQIGNSPSPLGSLLVNTVAFIKTSNPDKVSKAMKDGLTAMNGKTVQGLTYTTAYQENVKVGELTADGWSMKMSADPEDPVALQANQMNSMLFGPNGLSGYSYKTEGGVIMTYAKNQDLLNKTVASLKGGENLIADPEIKKIAAALPAERTFEGYLGVQSLMETIMGVVGMMGMAPNVNIPENIPPVGMGATTDGGALRFTVVIPTKVITSVKSVVEAMNPDGGKDEKPDAGQLKF